MSVTAVPTLTVGGTAIPTALAAGQLPALGGIDKLRLTWGRAAALEAPTPATAALAVLDTAAGAPFARRTDLIGQLVVLGWRSSTGATGTTFRGRVTDSAARPRAGGPATGFRVDLAASSVEVDLANYTVAEGTVWPAETVGARRIRLAALLPAGLFAGGVVLPDRFGIGRGDLGPDNDVDSWPVGQQDVGGRDLLSLLRQLFASVSSLPMIYDPAADRLTYAGLSRFRYTPAGLTMSAQLLASADHGGRYVAASLAGLHADGDAVPYTGGTDQAIDSRLTRIEVKWLDPADGYQQKTLTAATAQAGAETTIGRRVLSVDSVIADSSHAAIVAASYVDAADGEGRLPRLGALRFTTTREQLHDDAHVAGLLAGHERGASIFVGRSWLPFLGQRPLVGLIGGTVSYAGGDWSAELVPAPRVVDPSPFQWAPVTVAASATAGVRLVDVDRSVTFGDVAFVDIGAGYTLSTAFPYKGNPNP